MVQKTVLFLLGSASLASVVFCQTSLNMEYLGNWDDPSIPVGVYGRYSSCWGYNAPNGREYALVGTYTGTAIIDITDSTNLVKVAYIDGPASSWREMKTYSNFAYIVTENGDLSAGGGLQIVDLSNLPISASLVKTYIWTDTLNGVPIQYPRAHTVSVSGNYLYLNGGSNNGIRILDISDPLNPVKAGKYVGPYIHDSHIRNDTIFASAIHGEGLDIIDARNKSNPVRIKLLQYPNSGTHNAWTTTDGKYVVTTDEIGSTSKTLKVWDIHDITNPVKVSEFSPTTATVHNVFIKGNLAYVAWYAAGIRVIDVSDPTNLREVGYYDTYSGSDAPSYVGAWGAYPFFNSGKAIVSDMQTGLYVVRYKQVVTGVSAEASPRNFVLHQNFPNPFNPSTTVSFAIPRAERVSLKILNLLGQEVATLAEGEYEAGEHAVRVDGSLTASGVYFYKLIAGDYIAIRKMVLMK